MQSFSIRDLRERFGTLSREVEQSCVSVVTRHGSPLFITVPFSEELLREGVHVTLAVKLLQEGTVSLGKAAKLAKMVVAEFSEYVSLLGVSVVDLTEDELDEELAFLSS